MSSESGAESPSGGHMSVAAQLALMAIVGEAIFYGLYLVMARTLDDQGFESFAVAVAAVTLVAAFTTLGLDKYAMRVLPALYERGDWSRARGYTLFAVRRIVGASILGAVGIALLWTAGTPDSETGPRVALLVGAAALPAVASTRYGVEALSARGLETRAILLYRVAIPLSAIALLLGATALPLPIHGATATACWGLAWLLGMLAMWREAIRSRPRELAAASPRAEPSDWQRAALPFLAYGLAITSIAQIGVIALDRLQASPDTVGAYAVASRTANLIIVLATASNRFYAPLLSRLLERGDFQGMSRMRRQRWAWLVPALAFFLVAVFLFGDEVLAIFDPEFDEEAVTALRILSIAATVSTLFAISPTYLKYVERGRLVLLAAGAAALIQIALLVVLVPRYGATGAAIAYAAAMCGLYGTYMGVALFHLGESRRQQDGAP